MSFSISSNCCDASSCLNVPRNSQTSARSFSTAITRAPVASSSFVSAPLPGPISRMISPARTSAARARARAAHCPVRKCWPNLAPGRFLPDFIVVVEKPALLLSRFAAVGIGSEPYIDVGKEFRRYCALPRAVFGALVRITQKQVFARARERDVKQSPFFLRVTFGSGNVIRTHGRKESLFKTDDKYRIELQSLGRMHGHERYPALVGAYHQLILFALQCCLLQ